jgi:hypothetical protein
MVTVALEDAKFGACQAEDTMPSSDPTSRILYNFIKRECKHTLPSLCSFLMSILL